jgi:hypothetical protein
VLSVRYAELTVPGLVPSECASARIVGSGSPGERVPPTMPASMLLAMARAVDPVI